MNDDRKPEAPDLRAIRAAAKRIRTYAHRTPVLTCTSLNAMVGAELFFKCENLQKVGAFKFRGAANSVFSLSRAEAARGWPPTPRGTTLRPWLWPPVCGASPPIS